MSVTTPEPTGHSAFQSLPVVDVSGLQSPDPKVRQSSAEALGEAARDAGFLYITGHGVPSDLVDRFRSRVREYFRQSHDEKMRQYIGRSENHSGYVPEGEEQFYGAAMPDRKEAYDVNFDMLEPEHARPMLGPNQWPEMAGFKTDIKAYYDAVFELGNLLFRGFALALGLPEDSFTRHINRPPSQLRLIHYPYNPDIPTDAPGIGAHTDYECFTILRPTAPGLEVMNGAGEWIDVPVLEDAFVINIGDMMEILSNGLFIATSHRVRKVAEERYAFPMFCNLDYDTRIEPLPQLVSEERPARYEPQVCGEHLFAQTAQTFQYLKKRLESGELELPKGSKGLSSFGREAGGQR
ncbi:isopenicillin N synthase family oxygenase [Marinobacter sediminum]|uniref:isopenicillin N synthase family dioxygenase n=1 Tax=Marinobacter sediminum TaxID=256323 RepID=UPI00202ED9C9|nr:2-oxoglutarate and iron-dependent oxygenase domain-containing protein [Marinobacter sediminum]MCM0612951.1 isopenicillin N synthase family oxygenase [Marinobacter sediminum]